MVDADARGAGRVRLEFEDVNTEWYADAAVRAVESVLAPVGWREGEIRDYLADASDETLAAFAR